MLVQEKETQEQEVSAEDENKLNSLKSNIPGAERVNGVYIFLAPPYSRGAKF
jgi:hypothetical protein